jgi:hypothetical protein
MKAEWEVMPLQLLTLMVFVVCLPAEVAGAKRHSGTDSIT